MALVLSAANEVEMNFSGEFRATGRRDAIDVGMLETIDYASRVFTVAGLTATLVAEQQDRSNAPPKLLTGRSGSYRISTGQRGSMPMVSNASSAPLTESVAVAPALMA